MSNYIFVSQYLHHVNVYHFQHLKNSMLYYNMYNWNYIVQPQDQVPSCMNNINWVVVNCEQ
jgi:hypothetical protein